MIRYSIKMPILDSKVISMKATLEIDDALMQRLSEEARRRKTTVAALVEAGLKHVLDECSDAPLSRDGSRPPLPTIRSGGHLVDISNRDELYRIFDEDAGIRY